MLSKVFVTSVLFLTLLGAETMSPSEYRSENKILKLKLEIFALQAKNKRLQEVIDNLARKNGKEEQRAEALARERAIARFREELRLSRTTHR